MEDGGARRRTRSRGRLRADSSGRVRFRPVHVARLGVCGDIGWGVPTARVERTVRALPWTHDPPDIGVLAGGASGRDSVVLRQLLARTIMERSKETARAASLRDVVDLVRQLADAAGVRLTRGPGAVVVVAMAGLVGCLTGLSSGD